LFARCVRTTSSRLRWSTVCTLHTLAAKERVTKSR